MLLICDDSSRFTWTYFLRQKSDTVAVEVVRLDEGGEFKGDFAKLCRRHNIRPEFTTTDSAKCNEVVKRPIVMPDLAGLAAQVRANSLFRAYKIPFDSRLWSARNYWACYALNCTATSANNVGDKLSFKMRFGTVPHIARSISSSPDT